MAEECVIIAMDRAGVANQAGYLVHLASGGFALLVVVNTGYSS